MVKLSAIAQLFCFFVFALSLVWLEYFVIRQMYSHLGGWWTLTLLGMLSAAGVAWARHEGRTAVTVE